MFVLPVVIFFLTRSACRALQRSAAHPLRDWQGDVAVRGPDGAARVVVRSEDRVEAPVSEPAVGTVPGHSDYPTDP